MHDAASDSHTGGWEGGEGGTSHQGSSFLGLRVSGGQRLSGVAIQATPNAAHMMLLHDPGPHDALTARCTLGG